jgi:hypothetical protein
LGTRIEGDAPPRIPGPTIKGRGDMYIGVGTLVVILLVVLIIYFIRRA